MPHNRSKSLRVSQFEPRTLAREIVLGEGASKFVPAEGKEGFYRATLTSAEYSNLKGVADSLGRRLERAGGDSESVEIWEYP